MQLSVLGKGALALVYHLSAQERGRVLSKPFLLSSLWGPRAERVPWGHGRGWVGLSSCMAAQPSRKAGGGGAATHSSWITLPAPL